MIQLCANLTQLLIAYKENRTKCRFSPEIYEVLQLLHLEIHPFIRTHQTIESFSVTAGSENSYISVTFYI